MEQVKERAKFRGRFQVECLRAYDIETGKRFRDVGGRFLPRQVVWTEDVSNIVTNEGLDHILDVTLHGKTLVNPFYCVLFEDDHTPVAGDDYAAPGYTETEAYDEGTRPEYDEAAASSQSITNSASKATFTINATKTMYGASLVGGSAVKSDVTDAGTHVLLCAAPFGASRAVVDNDVINLTYTVTAADDA